MVSKKWNWVVPEKIHTPLSRGNQQYPPPTLALLDILYKFKTFFRQSPPPSRMVEISSVGGVWIFFGTTHFWHLDKTKRNITCFKQDKSQASIVGVCMFIYFLSA